MIVKLYGYFGIIGFLSIIGWVVALELLWVSSRRQKRPLHCFLALGAAITALTLAKVNSSNISAFELDRHDEMAAVMKDRKAAEAAEGTDATAPTLHFAEGNPEEPERDYRKKGKQVREVKGKKPAEVVDRGQADEEGGAPVRYLREADLLAANRLDRINLLIVRLILWLAMARVVVDYLTRLNSSAGGYFPLPIAGKWLDSLFGKTHSVLVKEPVDRGMTARAYAERAVRKGESFIYLGESDPWTGRNSLSRLGVGRWPLWSLPKLDYSDPEAPANGEFVLDAAWFNRCSVVAVRDEDCFPLLEHITMLLTLRTEVGATARKTVHIIWDLPQLPAVDELEPLIRIAPETNIKVAAWGHGPVDPKLVALFEEQIG